MSALSAAADGGNNASELFTRKKKGFHCIIAGGDSLRFICECLYLKPPTADTIAELQIIRACAEANKGTAD